MGAQKYNFERSESRNKAHFLIRPKGAFLKISKITFQCVALRSNQEVSPAPTFAKFGILFF